MDQGCRGKCSSQNAHRTLTRFSAGIGAAQPPGGKAAQAAAVLGSSGGVGRPLGFSGGTADSGGTGGLGGGAFGAVKAAGSAFSFGGGGGSVSPFGGGGGGGFGLAKPAGMAAAGNFGGSAKPSFGAVSRATKPPGAGPRQHAHAHGGEVAASAFSRGEKRRAQRAQAP